MLSYATPRTAIVLGVGAVGGIDADGRGIACAVALVGAAMAAKAAAHSTTNVFKGENPARVGAALLYTRQFR